MEGTAASCFIPSLYPIARVATLRGRIESPVQHECPQTEGSTGATLLLQVPHTSCQSPIPSRYHRRSWGCCPGERGERLQIPQPTAEPVINS